MPVCSNLLEKILFKGWMCTYGLCDKQCKTQANNRGKDNDMLWTGAISSGLTTLSSTQDPPLIQSLDLGWAKNTMLPRSRRVVIVVQTSRSVFRQYFCPETLPFEEVIRSHTWKEDEPVVLIVVWNRLYWAVELHRKILSTGWKIYFIFLFIHGQDTPLWSKRQLHPQHEQLKLLSAGNHDVIVKSTRRIVILSAVGPNLLAGKVKSPFVCSWDRGKFFIACIYYSFCSIHLFASEGSSVHQRQ